MWKPVFAALAVTSMVAGCAPPEEEAEIEIEVEEPTTPAEEIEEAADDTVDAMEEAADETAEAMDDAADEVEETVEEMEEPQH